jgi:hypothetical protein
MPYLGIGVLEAEAEEAIEDLLGDAVVEGQVEPEQNALLAIARPRAGQ